MLSLVVVTYHDYSRAFRTAEGGDAFGYQDAEAAQRICEALRGELRAVLASLPTR